MVKIWSELYYVLPGIFLLECLYSGEELDALLQMHHGLLLWDLHALVL